MGPARLRPHRAVVRALQKVCERGGAEVDLERAIPALFRVGADGKIIEAILDAYVISPSSFDSYAIDVTIRCPHGCRNQRDNSHSATH
eukprot:3590341-Karenia_brevis.AAC.1